MKTQYEENRESADKLVDKAEDEKKRIVGIILAICFASIGFSLSQLTKDDFQFVSDVDFGFIFYGIIGLALTVVLLISYRLFLYLSFSQMANYHLSQLRYPPINFEHKKWVYQLKLWLLPMSVIVFILSESVLLVGFMVRIFVY